MVNVLGGYVVGRTFGRGSAGTVRYATHTMTGEPVAIKTVKLNNDVVMQRIVRELDALHRVQHPYISRLLEVITTPRRICLILEFASGGDLLTLLLRRRRLDEREARRVFRQLLSAIHHCHGHGVHHGDVRPENIMLDQYLNVKLINFNFGHISEVDETSGALVDCETARMTTEHIASPSYAAPEMYQDKPYDATKCDIFELGMVLYVMLVGRLPFSHHHREKDVLRNLDIFKLTFPNHVPSGARAVIRASLAKDPKLRPTVEDLVQMPWVVEGARRPLLETLPLRPLDVSGPVTERAVLFLKQYAISREAVIDALSSGEVNATAASYFLAVDKLCKEMHKAEHEDLLLKARIRYKRVFLSFWKRMKRALPPRDLVQFRRVYGEGHDLSTLKGLGDADDEKMPSLDNPVRIGDETLATLSNRDVGVLLRRSSEVIGSARASYMKGIGDSLSDVRVSTDDDGDETPTLAVCNSPGQSTGLSHGETVISVLPGTALRDMELEAVADGEPADTPVTPSANVGVGAADTHMVDHGDVRVDVARRSEPAAEDALTPTVNGDDQFKGGLKISTTDLTPTTPLEDANPSGEVPGSQLWSGRSENSQPNQAPWSARMLASARSSSSAVTGAGNLPLSARSPVSAQSHSALQTPSPARSPKSARTLGSSRGMSSSRGLGSARTLDLTAGLGSSRAVGGPGPSSSRGSISGIVGQPGSARTSFSISSRVPGSARGSLSGAAMTGLARSLSRGMGSDPAEGSVRATEMEALSLSMGTADVALLDGGLAGTGDRRYSGASIDVSGTASSGGAGSQGANGPFGNRTSRGLGPSRGRDTNAAPQSLSIRGNIGGRSQSITSVTSGLPAARERALSDARASIVYDEASSKRSSIVGVQPLTATDPHRLPGDAAAVQLSNTSFSGSGAVFLSGNTASTSGALLRSSYALGGPRVTNHTDGGTGKDDYGHIGSALGSDGSDMLQQSPSSVSLSSSNQSVRGLSMRSSRQVVPLSLGGSFGVAPIAVDDTASGAATPGAATPGASAAASTRSGSQGGIAPITSAANAAGPLYGSSSLQSSGALRHRNSVAMFHSLSSARAPHASGSPLLRDSSTGSVATGLPPTAAPTGSESCRVGMSSGGLPAGGPNGSATPTSLGSSVSSVSSRQVGSTLGGGRRLTLGHASTLMLATDDAA